MPPELILRPKHAPLIVPAHLFVSNGFCRKCGQPFRWRVDGLTQIYAESDEDADAKERAWFLWKQYKERGWCPRCVPNEHRNFIAAQAEQVVYG